VVIMPSSPPACTVGVYCSVLIFSCLVLLARAVVTELLSDFKALATMDSQLGIACKRIFINFWEFFFWFGSNQRINQFLAFGGWMFNTDSLSVSLRI